MNELLPTPNDDSAPSQVEVYDDLKRIGELEDQKQKIQAEIDEKTDGLRAALKHIDKSSLLYSMLSSALAPATKPAAKTAKKATRKKTTSRSRK